MANTGKTEINTRIVLKHDSEEKWSQSTLVPYQGEVIIYDADVNNPKSEVRFKIGDGITAAKDLPFAILTPNEIEEIVSETTSYGVVRKKGSIVSAESLKGLAIDVTSNINFIQSENSKGELNPSPSDPCLISGWKTATVTRRSGNFFGGLPLAQAIRNAVPSAELDEEAKTIKYEANSVRNVTLFKDFDSSKLYTFVFKRDDAKSSGNTANLAIKTSKSTTGVNFSSSGNPFVYTTRGVTELSGYFYGGTTYLLYDECGIFEGALDAEDFAPYETTMTATLSETETIYGGTLNWNTGELTVTKVREVLSGTEPFVVQEEEVKAPGCTGFYLKVNTWKKPSSVHVTCSHGVDAVSGSSQDATTPNAVRFNSLRTNLLLNMDSNTCGDTVEKFQKYLVEQKDKGTPFTLVYEIENPYTIQLTPQQLMAVEGVNTIWSDCGDTCAIFNYTPLNTDATLTISGMAADAKVTGEEIKKLKSSISQVPDVSGQIDTHNASNTAHKDIRDTINGLSDLIGDEEDLPEGIATVIGAIKSVKDNIPSTDDFATKDDVTNQISDKVDKTTTINEKELSGNITLSAEDVGALPVTTEIPSIEGLKTYVSTQISTAIDEIEYPVTKVNGHTGDITLTAEDVGALPDNTIIPSTESFASKDYVDTKLSDLIGNESVEAQITKALADVAVAITNPEIDAICGTTLEFDDLLTDETTGTAYKLYVSEGNLKMTEVSE